LVLVGADIKNERRLSVPYFQWHAVERYQASSTVLSSDQCR